MIGYSQKETHSDEIPIVWISDKPRQLTSPSLGQPLDINDNNEILFGSHILSSSGKRIDLSPVSDRYIATAINNKSRIVGIEVQAAHDWAATHYSYGHWNRLELLEREGSDTKDINDEGTIAGWHTGAPCIWVNGHRRFLGCLPNRDSGHALKINNRNQVVGFCYEAAQHVRHGKSHYRAFLWHRGKLSDLGALSPEADSCARGISDQGVIVGWSSRIRPAKDTLGPRLPTYAVVWHQRKIIDLNMLVKPPPGFLLDTASDINNKNQIIGTMVDSKKQEKGFLLTPY